MFNFDGNYRRLPVQNLGGASQTSDRESVIRKAQLERQKRNLLRQQNNAATVIQSYARSFIWRQRCKRQERAAFDEYLHANRNTTLEDDKLAFLLLRLNFCYNPKNAQDRQRLIDLCQQILRQQIKTRLLANCARELAWQLRLSKLLDACLTQLAEQATLQAMPMRMLETFMTACGLDDGYLKRLYAHFSDKRDYFERVYALLNDKCPPLDIETVQPPNPMLDVIAQLIKCPLALAKRLSSAGIETNDSDQQLAASLCSSFIIHMLSRPHTLAVRNFLLPHLAQEFTELPFECIVRLLAWARVEQAQQQNAQQQEQWRQQNALYAHTQFGSDQATTSAAFEQQEPAPQQQQQFKPKKHINLNSFLLHSLLSLDRNHYAQLRSESLITEYVLVLARMSARILLLPKPDKRLTHAHVAGMHESSDESSDDELQQCMDVDDDGDDEDAMTLSTLEKSILIDAIARLNEPARVDVIVAQLSQHFDNYELLCAVCEICHNLSIYDRHATFDQRLLYTLAFIPNLLRGLWLKIESTLDEFSAPLRLISKGIAPQEDSLQGAIPLLATFCTLLGRLLPTLHDVEFLDDYSAFGNTKRLMPYSLNEILRMIKFLKEISVGLVELAFPETKSKSTISHYRLAFGKSNNNNNSSSKENTSKSRQLKQIWSNLLKVVVYVLNQLHARDLRLSFCPKGHWCCENLNLPLDRPTDLPLTRSSRMREIRPFYPIRDFTRADFEHGPPMSMKQIRSITILREIPFVVQFNRRVNILQGLIAADKLRVQGEHQDFLQGPSTTLAVRRTHLYEDAFEKLSRENEPDLRIRIRVQFISTLGLDEAGIDGGGIFREFLSELLRTAFDPNRGFFMLTTDNKLYPNPNIGDICASFEDHYYFIGRILGKAIYENLLVELPLADFFLTKLAGKYADADIHQLASLDPVLYKNLLYLKDNDKDAAALNLDFTVACCSLGQTRVVELVPDGQSIPVTSSNCIKYVQLVADYKLNVQIRRQCTAFRRGLSDVLPIEWLYMFSCTELHTLVSGAEIPIDLADMKKHCRYGADYSPEHPAIIAFWTALESFSDAQRRQLMKFVTSCSRPPLLGFKNLDPPFTIQNSSSTNRLPTASTCINLLKLPPFQTVEEMREKLLYAIQAGQGFELS